MPEPSLRRSPLGRPIHVREVRPRVVPDWVVRRRRAYHLIDAVAAAAKHAVRQWLAPRPSVPQQAPD
ncbi:MAG: hypothetical protein JOZ81_12550 [Chloroflexi bacterium]|nr:hypothetical protein [Chloroflexota bacterium]MBV9542871.1 hypothetical protein [Chloroflexota bacterium]